MLATLKIHCAIAETHCGLCLTDGYNKRTLNLELTNERRTYRNYSIVVGFATGRWVKEWSPITVCTSHQSYSKLEAIGFQLTNYYCVTGFCDLNEQN